MQIIQSRRDFLTGLSAAGAVSALGARSSTADEPSPEITTVRLRYYSGICIAPWFIAEDVLHAEGSADVRYLPVPAGATGTQMIARGEVDFALSDPETTVFRLDSDVPITVLAGMYVGCFERFAREPIHSISDLKCLAAYTKLHPHKDIEWVDEFSPEPQELLARKIVNTTTGKPWSEYFCCMLLGNREFVRNHPVATKRLLRALLEANDICAAEPGRAAKRLVDAGITERYDYAPYAQWREFDAEYTLRCFARRQHRLGMIKSSPDTLIAEGSDWRFLNELKRELKA
jgi:NitT/TauT family transport system substrate-binding protein